MIQVKDLFISFDGKTIIDGVSFLVPEGKSLVLMGKNGSGKSVILKALSGLIEYKGRIELNGVDIAELYKDRYRIGAAESAGYLKIAYVFQKGGLFDSMNVYDNVAFGMRRVGADEKSVEESVLNSLGRVGLKGNEMKLISELSGGMQKRVGLARALCLKPNIIFFDDPTAGLDPILSDSIIDLMREIKVSLNTTSIIATHDIKMVERLADSIALLYDGKIVFEGDGPAFLSRSDPYASQFIEGDIEGPIDMF